MFKTYMRLLGFARPIKKYAIPYFFYSLFYALFNSLTLMLIIPILNTMFDANYSFEYVEKLPPLELNQDYLATLFNFAYSHIFEQYDRQNVLMLLAIVAICISLMSNLFRYLGAWTMENMRTRTLQRMRNEMFSRVMDMNVGYFSDQRKGDIISKITSDVGVVQFCITNTLQVSFREPFLIIGYIVMMVAISWELAIFSVLFLPVVALLIGSIVKKLRHPARTNQQRMGEMVSTLDESLSGIKVIKSYNATEYIKQKYYAISADLARLTLSMARRQQLASPMSEFLGITAVGVILVFGGSLVAKGVLDPGGFIAFIAIFLAAVVAILIWVVLNKTTFGYELKAVGLNKSAARYAGINEKKNIILSMAIAGALAGFGAGLFYLSNVGQWNPLNSTSLPAMGFNGISVALLASSNPIGTIFSALFISHISVGGTFLSTKYYPTEIADLISGIIIYLCAFSMLFRGKIQKLLFKNADKTNVNAEPAPAEKANAKKEGK